jgi:hypothetical protein
MPSARAVAETLALFSASTLCSADWSLVAGLATRF